MTKKVILTSTIVAFIFSGCLSSGSAKPTIDKATKVTDKVEKKVDKATNMVNKAKETTETAKSVIKTADSVSNLPKSELKDKVIESVVEIGDDSVDSTTPQVIESVD
jgi:PBP1b-binding outer membrane lipoprotein LpoB